jgi:hypothetical protein
VFRWEHIPIKQPDLVFHVEVVIIGGGVVAFLIRQEKGSGVTCIIIGVEGGVVTAFLVREKTCVGIIGTVIGVAFLSGRERGIGVVCRLALWHLDTKAAAVLAAGRREVGLRSAVADGLKSICDWRRGGGGEGVFMCRQRGGGCWIVPSWWATEVAILGCS